MPRTCLPLVSAIIAGLVLAAGADLDAAKKKSGKSKGTNKGKGGSKLIVVGTPGQTRYMKYVTAMLPRSRAAAAKANAALQSSQQRVRVAATALRGATDRLDDALQRKEQIEADLFASLADDAPLRQVWVRYESARQDLQQATDRALSTDEYTAALAKARQAVNHGELMAELRRDALDRDHEVQRCQARIGIAKDELETARRTALDADPQWAAAGFAARSAREDVRRAERNLDDALTGRFKTKAVANKAAAAVATGENAKRALAERKTPKAKGGKKGKNKGGGKSKSKSGSKRKSNSK